MKQYQYFYIKRPSRRYPYDIYRVSNSLSDLPCYWNTDHEKWCRAVTPRNDIVKYKEISWEEVVLEMI